MKCKDVKSAIDSASRRNPLESPAAAHVSGCPDCRRYSDEADSLKALLNTQPRVEAPADFDFRLRARIARAQAEPRGRFAFLQNLFGRSFSWAQAGAAMAAVALAVTLASSYFIGGKQSAPTGESLAKVNPQIAKAAPVGTVATEAMEIKSDAVKVAAKHSKTNAPALQPVVFSETPKPAILAAKEDMTRFYSHEKRQVISTMSRTTLVGAEDAGLSKPASFVASF